MIARDMKKRSAGICRRSEHLASSQRRPHSNQSIYPRFLRRVFFARFPARLKNSMISVGDFLANSFGSQRLIYGIVVPDPGLMTGISARSPFQDNDHTLTLGQHGSWQFSQGFQFGTGVIGSPHRRALLQFFKPVEDDLDPQSLGGSSGGRAGWQDDDELLSVRCDVVGSF